MMRTVVTSSAESGGWYGGAWRGTPRGRLRLSGDQRRGDGLGGSKEHTVQGVRVCIHIYIYMPVCERGCVCVRETKGVCMGGPRVLV